MPKPRRFVIASDNHGDMQDDRAVEALMNFIEDFKPAVRIHAGDNWDFRNIRRGASDEDRRDSLQDDWDAGREFFLRFFSGGKENHFLFGNHDDRLFQIAQSTQGLVRDYAQEGIDRVNALCRLRRVRSYPYDSALGILKLGHLSVLHGYFAGVNACQQHARVYGNCVFGHVHTMESAPVPSLEPAEARSNPCLCVRDMGYMNAKTGKLKWAQGWSYGYTFDDGSYQLFQTRKINNAFHVATEIKAF